MGLNRLTVGALLAVVAVAAVGFGGWHFLIRGDEPPPVNLEAAVAAAEGESATDEASGTDSPAATAGDLSGTWIVDPANEQTFVGYRIEEELANIGSATAVGRTSEVAGTLEFDGETITAVEVTADLRTLTSDDDRRDGQLQKQALESNEFPEATFVLAEALTLEGDPASGEDIAATAVGDFTIHGVTKRVELDLQGRLVGDQVVVVGSTVILLADYGIEPPNSMMVLSVSDEATMEMQLVFTRP